MERVERLRLKALEPVICRDEFYYLFHTHYRANPGADAFERYAQAVYPAFSHLTPCISEDELILGKCDRPLPPAQEKDWQENVLPGVGETVGASRFGQDSHMTIDYDLVLQKGLRGIMAEVDGHLSACEEEKTPFYRACRRCLEAVIVHSENYAAAAEKLAETAEPARREELLNWRGSAARCRHSPQRAFTKRCRRRISSPIACR